MSTKIYTAYRTRPGVELFELVRDLRQHGARSVHESLKVFYKEVASAASPTQPLLRAAMRLRPDDEPTARVMVADRIITRAYRLQLGSHHRSMWNLDVSIAIRRYADRYYLIPHCDGLMRESLAFLAEHPLLEDFAYWNSSDKPKEIDEESWEERRAIWHAMFPNWQDVLALDLCSWPMFWQVSPWMDIVREVSTRRPRNIGGDGI